jgi:outer membrane beta-barrel protein
METRFRVLLLIPVFALGFTGCGIFGGSKKPPAPLGSETETATTAAPPPQSTEEPVINPQIERRQIKTPKIKNEDFEIGAYIGILSIEDFGTGSVYGARLSYHVNEDLFLDITAGQGKGDKTSYERLAGGAQLLTDSQRKYTYYALNAGWDALPGEIFIGKGRAYNTSFYLTVGMGGTKFAGDNRFTANAGVGYRLLFNRWVAAHFDFRDYLFDIDLLGQKKVAHNLEGSLGLSVYF